MDVERVRAWWWRRQGLDGSMSGWAPADVLAATGWARSVAGSNPYLTLWSRSGCARAVCDEAVAGLAMHELPSARGCTYVVPSSDYELALKVAAPFAGDEMKTARRLGVTDAEIDRLKARILDALRDGPLDVEPIREAVGDAARSLGPEGAKKGVTTTLPVALGLLQTEGEIRRIPVNGRLDQQRYRYSRWGCRPAAGPEAFTELGKRYFRWIGPATLADFQWFSGLGAKAAKEAVAPLGLAAYGMRLMFPDDLDAMLSMKLPDAPDYRVVSSLDGFNQLRRDLRDLLIGEDLDRVPAGARDFPNNAILDRGRLVGLWEFDPDTQRIAWSSFIHINDQIRAALKAAGDYIRAELGDVRSYSLDSPASRRGRIEALRARS